jgi:hypothetical protein
MNRFDLVSPRKGRDDKTRWHKVGAAFPRDKGGYQLVFDALPLPDAEGRVTLMMWEAQERDDPRGGQSTQARAADRAQRPAGGAPAGADMDDEIPFSMEWR